MIGLVLGACIVGVVLVIERRRGPEQSSMFLLGIIAGSFCMAILEAVS